MCGRYSITLPVEALRRMFAVEGGVIPNWPARYNVAPTQDVPLVRLNAEGARELVAARWGLVPGWAKEIASSAPLINARADGAAEKPSFRDAFRKRRGLMPADGFYEWQATDGKAKQPWRIARADGEPFAFAALWERWRGPDGPIESCALLTTDAPPSLAAIHHRVPVILPPETWARWLDPETPQPELQALLAPPPDGVLAAQAISTRVNAVANDGPELWEPATAEPPQPKPARPRRAAPGGQGSLF